MPTKPDTLLACAPITEKPGIDRAMRVAIQRARHGKQAPSFSQQQAFDLDTQVSRKSFRST